MLSGLYNYISGAGKEREAHATKDPTTPQQEQHSRAQGAEHSPADNQTFKMSFKSFSSRNSQERNEESFLDFSEVRPQSSPAHDNGDEERLSPQVLDGSFGNINVNAQARQSKARDLNRASPRQQNANLRSEFSCIEGDGFLEEYIEAKDIKKKQNFALAHQD